jgi:hypothetical protein
MKARALSQHKTEACFSVSALNRMTNPGMPVFVKVWKVASVGGFALTFLYSTAPMTNPCSNEHSGA